MQEEQWPKVCSFICYFAAHWLPAPAKLTLLTIKIVAVRRVLRCAEVASVWGRVESAVESQQPMYVLANVWAILEGSMASDHWSSSRPVHEEFLAIDQLQKELMVKAFGRNQADSGTFLHVWMYAWMTQKMCLCSGLWKDYCCTRYYSCVFTVSSGHVSLSACVRSISSVCSRLLRGE